MKNYITLIMDDVFANAGQSHRADMIRQDGIKRSNGRGTRLIEFCEEKDD